MSLEQQRITGIEAQLRWRHPELGEIPPAEFLPLAERAGLIGELMRWALEEAAAVAAGLPQADEPAADRAQGARPATSATGTLVADVEQALRRSGLAPERLVLQIKARRGRRPTTSASGSTSPALRLMGVHVALDGFGSGSSALAHLTRLPIDIVKLDRAADHPDRPRPAEPGAVRVDHRHRAGRSGSTSSPRAWRRRPSWPR